mmetsp:Transcript_6822/g.14238  ORF Transcript_6822/g.14238 Transcript_6822/m.14238 type:complete len:81 (-) Transcript_6822:1066-1308(-)
MFPPTRYGLKNAPVLPIALAEACPVVLTSVVYISAVETHVTQLPIISNALAKNDSAVRIALFDVTVESIESVKSSVPPNR